MQHIVRKQERKEEQHILFYLPPELQTLVGTYLDPRSRYIISSALPAVNIRRRVHKFDLKNISDLLSYIPPIHPTKGLIDGSVVILPVKTDSDSDSTIPRSYLLRYYHTNDKVNGENLEHVVEIAVMVDSLEQIDDQDKPYDSVAFWFAYRKECLKGYVEDVEGGSKDRDDRNDIVYVRTYEGGSEFSGWFC